MRDGPPFIGGRLVKAIYKAGQREGRNCLAHSADDINALLAASATISASGSTG